MIVTFHSDVGSVLLFGDVAITLLQMAGHSGTVPGAFVAAGLPTAIANLKQQLADAPGQNPAGNNPEAAPAIGLRLRAYPLLKLLTAAEQQKCGVMWDAGPKAAR